MRDEQSREDEVSGKIRQRRLRRIVVKPVARIASRANACNVPGVPVIAIQAKSRFSTSTLVASAQRIENRTELARMKAELAWIFARHGR